MGGVMGHWGGGGWQGGSEGEVRGPWDTGGAGRAGARRPSRGEMSCLFDM